MVIRNVYKVEVDSGVESVLLPFKTTVSLTEEVTVMWRNNSGMMVDCNYFKELQLRQYKGRTEMKENYKSRDFSLTLKNPTDRDRGIYTCTVYRKEKILAEKQVLLNVKADSPIIAIDFGSGYSGYAFNLKPREEGGETQLKRWGKEVGLDSPKTPTCILFDEDKQFLEFGYKAKTAYSNMTEEEAEKHYFFEDFKRNILFMEGHSVYMEITLLSLDIEFCIKESLEHFPDVLNMGLFIRRENQNVININKDADIE
ncbi:uncharacterized protein LOC118559102 [Fundulus heteroclitus]|uniref:uncharacterized protein LOC118559102 n=1 Tax=Fundulus heteroclitus TaxID=8078 RepID=UPI00165C2503|nr:uncharacterized protein LOC118559102 [Fundulus heteroclitus]